MDNVSPELLVKILRDCAARAPEPLYPAQYVQNAGVDRPTLDRELDRLRLGGLLRLTDWMPGMGQGYVLTPEGQEALHHPQLAILSQLANPSSPQKTSNNRSSPLSVEVLSASPGRDQASLERNTPWDRGEAVRGSLLEVPPPVVTMTLLGLNILMFVLGGVLANLRNIPLGEYISFNSDHAGVLQVQTDLGALTPFHVLAQNQWWRLLSSCFVHGGFLHLFMNMYFLFSVGPRLESMWGRAGFLFLYVVSGFTCGVAVLLMESAPFKTFMGASGALCGLLTSLVFWIWLNRQHLGPELTRMWLRNVFMNIFLIMLISILPMVSATGHIGGGVGGLAVAYPMTYFRFGNSWQRRLGLMGMLAVPLLAVALLVVLVNEKGEHFQIQVQALKQAQEKAQAQEKVKVVKKQFANAEKTAISTYNEYAVPLLNLPPRTPVNKDPEKIRQAQEAFLKAHKEIEAAIQEARSLGPLPEPSWTEEITFLQNYLQSHDKIFEQFAKVLQQVQEHPDTWPSHKEELIQQIQLRDQYQEELVNQKLAKENAKTGP